MTEQNITWCKRCIMPSSRPRMIIPEDGICPACRWAEEKQAIDWNRRAEEFRDLISSFPKNTPYNCVVPFSGGKDSASIAYKLKHQFGLKPLLVCYGQLLWTEAGRRNLNRVAHAGLDINYWRVNQAVSRKLARRFFIERGHPKQAYDSAVNAVPMITAAKFGIPYVFYAEHGETEYGGRILSEEHRKKRDLSEVLEHQVGDDARNWAVDGISEDDLYPYIYPDPGEVKGMQALYFSYFFKWDIFKNYRFCRDNMKFEVARTSPRKKSDRCDVKWGRSCGSFEGFDSIDDMIDDLDYYMMHVKFGFGRSARMASRLIQNGHITRDDGLKLVRMYDGEPPRYYMSDIQNYLGMDRNELIRIVDKHRNKEIWREVGEKWKWELKNPPL